MWEQISSYVRYLWNSYELPEILAELLVIGFLVYSVMRFLRGTGGEKLGKGMVVLLLGFWGISILTGVFPLDRLGFLFKYFLVAALVVATVAFQPELRRGLMRLGGTRFGRTTAPEMHQVIEQVVDAAAVLSRTQIGALIAFEREVGLGDLVASGTRIYGRVSDELLTTVFWPGSPLHDMGVVIRRDKLAAAGVQFPLAEHGEYDRLLGSRHRAAIGLSKESDAVVVVISEETGNIGVAVNGKLTRFLTLEQLRQQLFDLLMTPLASEKKQRKDRLTSAGPAGETPEKPPDKPGKTDQQVASKA